MLAVITESFKRSNQIEAVVWWVVALIAWKAARDRGFPRAAIAFLVTLLIFGCSDLVEAHTGAWWRPWWLFLWKAACVITLLALLIGCKMSAKSAAISPHSNPPAPPAG